MTGRVVELGADAAADDSQAPVETAALAGEVGAGDDQPPMRPGHPRRARSSLSARLRDQRVEPLGGRERRNVSCRAARDQPQRGLRLGRPCVAAAPAPVLLAPIGAWQEWHRRGKCRLRTGQRSSALRRCNRADAAPSRTLDRGVLGVGEGRERAGLGERCAPRRDDRPVIVAGVVLGDEELGSAPRRWRLRPD